MPGEPRPEKVAVVTEVRERLSSSNGALLTEYRGLKVSDLATLRRSVGDAGGEYRIFKNINSVDRRARTAAFVQAAAADPLRALLYAPDRREPFAALHALGDAF